MQQAGGLHRIYELNQPNLTDSGGYQVFTFFEQKNDRRRREIQVAY